MATVFSGNPLDAPEATIFSFDDYAIPFRRNLILTMKQAEKYAGNPVLRRGPAGAPDEGATKFYGTVIQMDGKLKMWYTAQTDVHHQRIAYAESTDGIIWMKPVVGLVDYNGSRRNNLLMPRRPEDGGDYNQCPAVLFEPDEPDPSKRYKMTYVTDMGSQPAQQDKLGPMCAYSADGLDWRLAPTKPDADDRFEITGLYKFGGYYYATGQRGTPDIAHGERWTSQRVLIVFISPDFVHWSDAKALGFVRHTQLVNQSCGEQIHMGAGIWNRGNVLLGIYGAWHGGPGHSDAGDKYEQITTVDLGFVISNDGIHFREPEPDFYVLTRGPEGAWDHNSLYQGNGFINMGDKTYIWYSAWKEKIFVASQDIGLAMFRRDGFGCLSTKFAGQDSHFLTCRLQLGGKNGRLFVNADGLSEQSFLTVSLLDARLQPIAGYSDEASIPLKQSGLRQEVTWRGKDSIAFTEPFLVKVSFHGAGPQPAQFYAMYLEDSK